MPIKTEQRLKLTKFLPQDILLGLTTPIYCAEDESLHEKNEEEEEEEGEEVGGVSESWPGTSQSTYEKL